MRLLIDMDGVIANFEQGVLDIYRKEYPDNPYIPLEKRTTFYIESQYPPEIKPLLEKIYFSKDFFLNLKPIKGALEALCELSDLNYEIFICTSPLLKNPYCIPEKYEWVSNNLGNEWIKNIIVSKDKTIVHGDILIDDNPSIKGIQNPSWEHILYEQPYNKAVTSKRRLTWQNWKEILELQ